MAKLELSEETKAGMEQVGTADLLIAVAVPVDADRLRTAATQGVMGATSLSALRTVIAFPGASSVEPVVKAEMDLDQKRALGVHCAELVKQLEQLVMAQ